MNLAETRGTKRPQLGEYHDETRIVGRGCARLRCGGDAGEGARGHAHPGCCAQFYPNANCKNKGPNNPYIRDYQRRLEMRYALAFGASPCVPERNSSWAAVAAASIATDRHANEASAGATAGAHSLAMPISLITRAYLES